MSEVTDEQRVETVRDRYGKVAYEASVLYFAKVWAIEWEDLSRDVRMRYGQMAEAVIDAYTAGPPPGADGREGKGDG